MWSPLDFVSGYGAVSTPFRAEPTRTFFRRALGRTLERGNETAHRPTAAASEPVASRPHTEPAVECSNQYSLSLAWENRKGGTPFARFFPLFLAGQEIEPPEANNDLYKLQFSFFPVISINEKETVANRGSCNSLYSHIMG